ADREAGRVLRRPARPGDRGRGQGDVLARRGPGVRVPLPGGAVRDTSRPVRFLPSARAVFDISLEGMLWSRRSLVLGLFLAVPVLLAIVYRVVLVAHLPAEITGLHLYGYLVALFW